MPRRPVDLDRALAAPGLDLDRTRRFLAGELKGGPVARDNTLVRVPNDLLERVDALLPVMEAKADREVFGWRKPSRTGVVRLALARGLEALEREWLGEG